MERRFVFAIAICSINALHTVALRAGGAARHSSQLRSINANVNAQEKSAQDMAKNPVRKVVTLLQNMAKKVEKEALEEKALYDKFVCYCSSEGDELEKTIGDSTAKVPQLQSDIETAQSEVERLKQDLKKHQTDRAAAKTAMAEATNLREKENFAFNKEAGDLRGYVKGLDVAIPAIESGMAGTAALLQSTSQVAMLRHAVNNDQELTDDDRDTVTAFLDAQVGSSDAYVPKSGDTVGILKDMRDNFAKSLTSLEDTEKQALETFDELMAAKSKEVNTLNKSIEKKTARIGELGVEIVSMKNDLTDTEAALIEDKNFLQEISTDCDSKQKEFAERVATRGEELTAIHDTIKILNDDDALELFKKTLPGAAGFLQIRFGEEQLRERALALLRRNRESRDKVNGPDLRFVEVALSGGKVDFSKVIKMIDDMVAILKEEQLDDDNKKEYCSKSLDITQDKLKNLGGTAQDLETSIDDAKNTLASLAEEIKTLQDGIKDLDRSVTQITEQRKVENEEFTELMSSDTAAKELLEFAKNRLNKFYNPSLYKAPAKQEDEAAAEFLQVKLRVRKDEPPKTWEGEYKKKNEESNGVIAMLDLLLRDLDKEMAEAEKQESLAQKEYEGLMTSSAKKRAKDVKLIAVKEASKADTEELLTKSEGDLDATHQELMATKAYEGQLHGECDWLLQYFDLRKSARSEEIDNLKSAKAVLSGADFS